MAKFRRPKSKTVTPTSSALLFRDLRRDPSMKFLWGHQEKVLEDYDANNLRTRDLALELPTGTGKTLIGLLIGEYRRRSLGERVAYLCPNRQLASQVHRQAGLYGVESSLLVGRQRDYDEAAFHRYQLAHAVAVTTYSAIFNSNPKIDDAQLIICDDAHAADSFVAGMWNVDVERRLAPELYDAIVQALGESIPDNLRHAIDSATDDGSAASYRGYVDIVSPIACYDRYDSLRAAIDTNVRKNKLRFPWEIINGALDACLIYASPFRIEIRAPIPPTKTHKPFAGANQRVFMSATLGADGDIERMFGIPKIERTPIPDGWEKRGTGRRLIFFPGMAEAEHDDLVLSLAKESNRVLALVPDNRSRDAFASHLKQHFEILGAEEIETDLKEFTEHSGPVVLIVANRYDGIDLPGDDCRLMFITGYPKGSSLQDRFLVDRIGAASRLRDRIRTRITQALGRCTRDESDFALVAVTDGELLKWFCSTDNTSGMHPELQAEIEFGIDNSKDRKQQELLELSREFLQRTNEWFEAEEAILELRAEKTKSGDASAERLSAVVADEIAYQYALWDGSYDDALKRAKNVVAGLAGGETLRPYRSFWHHQEAVAAYLQFQATKRDEHRLNTIAALESASKTSRGVRWLAKLRSSLGAESADEATEDLPVQEWFCGIKGFLADKGATPTKFHRNLAEVRAALADRKAERFERGLEDLGRMLGAKTYRWSRTAQGAPDGLWFWEGWRAVVFEAKTDSSADHVALFNVRQALTHEARVRADKLIPPHTNCVTVVVSSHDTVQKEASAVAEDLCHVRHDAIIELFDSTKEALEHVHNASTCSSDEALYETAYERYSTRDVFMTNVLKRLQGQLVGSMPVAGN